MSYIRSYSMHNLARAIVNDQVTGLRHLKAMREKRGMTRKAMADAIGAEISTYRQWEQMRFFQNSRWLPLIAEVLECRISDLF